MTTPRRGRIPGIYTRRGRTLYVQPAIDDDLDPDEKNALAIRNACATEGRCPRCHVVGVVHPDPVHPRLWHYIFEHESWCEAAA